MKITTLVTALLLFLSNSRVSTCLGQGSLTPPGAPTPTMKSLNQIEPRIPILSLPFTITNSGSYYLTGSLTATGATAGIFIQSDINDVVINLNGFALIGNNTSTDGIVGTGSQATNIVIVNGALRGWTTAVNLYGANRSRMERLLISENRGAGILLATDATVRDCSVLTGGTGIQVSTRGLVVDCLVSGSTNVNSAGIVTGSSSIVTRCRVENGSGVGVWVLSESEVSHCRIVNNPLDGIRCDNRCTITENYVNGTGTASGTNACIHSTLDSNRIEQNHVLFHQIGIKVDQGSSLIIRNSAYSNGTNYVINVNNQFGPINSLPGVVTNHPWANFAL
jgi:hypothetical protein